ncbi:hypothetical protein DL93DRAFT_1657357 [Clavulina sp. PMI_390]|nr:hypothetical protein DL93DRAFT_1657357 [Clavulina sp. PMI_390]
MNKSTHTREETVEEKTGQRLAAYLDAISDEHERITRLHTELVKDPDFDSDKVEHLDPEKLVSVFDLMLKSSLWGSRAQRDAFDNLGTHLALTFTNNIHFNLGQFAKVETHAAYAPGHKGLIDYSVSAWNYVLYYVFSEDPDFPSPDEVDEALGINIKVTKVNRRKQDAELVTGPKTWEEGEELRRERRAQPQNAAIIRKCSKRFWLMPCRGRLPTPPGWMERMDEGWILHLGDITDAVCNQESPEWNEGFWSWCDHAITALIELAIDSGNPLTPEQIARAKYLFFGYSKFHAKMPYLTMTPIKEMDVAFRSAPVALCELASWAFAHLIHGVAVQGRGGLRMNDASAIFLHFLYTDKHLSTMRWGERQSLSLNVSRHLAFSVCWRCLQSLVDYCRSVE